MRNPWFPFYWADYLAATPDLSLTEHGAYLLLLCECYRRGGRLPAPSNPQSIGLASVEHRLLHKVCRADTADEKAAVDSVLWRYFQHDGDGYHHERVAEEIDKRSKRQEKGRSAAAAKYREKASGRRAELCPEHHSEHSPEECEKACLEDGSHSSQPQGFTPPITPSVREGERTTAPPLPAVFQTGKGPSQKTRQAMQWVTDNVQASPAKIADMRRQDRALNRAIDMVGGWSVLSKALLDPVEAPDMSGRFMRSFGAACAESAEEKLARV